MNVGILGTGDVGQALGRGFVALGHAVKAGARGWAAATGVLWGLSCFLWRRVQATPASA